MAGIWFDEEGHPNICFERSADEELSKGESLADSVTRGSFTTKHIPAHTPLSPNPISIIANSWVEMLGRSLYKRIYNPGLHPVQDVSPESDACAESKLRSCRDMEIIVSGINGHICNLVADTSWVGRDVKKAVAAVTNIPECCMQLFKGACGLEDNEEVERLGSSIVECSLVLRSPAVGKNRLYAVRTVIEYLVDPCNIARCRIDGATVTNCRWITKSDGHLCPAWPLSHFCGGARAKRLNICEYEVRAAAIASSASSSAANFCFRVPVFDPDDPYPRPVDEFAIYAKKGVRVELLSDDLVSACEPYAEDILNKLRFGHACDIANVPKAKDSDPWLTPVSENTHRTGWQDAHSGHDSDPG